MSLLNFLLYKIIDDEKFGQLKFSKVTSECWRGKILFHPIHNEINIYFFDIEDKVSEDQKQFYDELEERYVEIKTNINNILQDHPQRIKHITHINFNKFNLVGLSFPIAKQMKEISFYWTMYFSDASAKRTLCVGIKNWKPAQDEFYFEE